jgi:hypothetical protein
VTTQAYRLDEAMEVEVRGEWVLALAGLAGEQFALVFPPEAAAATGEKLIEGARAASGDGGVRTVAQVAVLLPSRPDGPGELRLIMEDGTSAAFPATAQLCARLSRQPG